MKQGPDLSNAISKISKLSTAQQSGCTVRGNSDSQITGGDGQWNRYEEGEMTTPEIWEWLMVNYVERI